MRALVFFDLGHVFEFEHAASASAAAIASGTNNDSVKPAVPSPRIPAERLGAHTFGFDELHEAYDVFRNAAVNKALKVVISA